MPLRRRRPWLFSSWRVPRLALASVAMVAVGVVVGSAPGGTASARSPDAPTNARLAVVACPTTYAIAGTPAVVPLPRTTTLSVPRQVASQLAVYADTRGFMKLLGPRGWKCTASYGADGSGGMFVYPHRETISTTDASRDAHDQAIVGGESWACVGCTLGLACPLFPAAAASFQSSFNEPCTKTRPRSESAVTIDPGVVAFTDPPHVAGDGVPSGGPYPADGVMTYHPGDQNGTWEDTCAVPKGRHALCTAALNQFVSWYGTE